MKKLYFDISNGEVVKGSSSLPAFFVVIDWKGKIVEMRACFSQRNIENYGEAWKNKQLAKERDEWNSYKWLRKSLWRYIARNIFRRFPHYESQLNDRFIYLTF